MTIPKLSEAIRLGAMVIPQTCCYKGCALGAAVYAIGRNHHHSKKDEYKSVGQEADEAWPFITTLIVKHPQKQFTAPLRAIIGELNGFAELHWTRERIAAWVATVEPLDKDAKDIQRELEESLDGSEDNSGYDAVEMGQCGHDE